MWLHTSLTIAKVASSTALLICPSELILHQLDNPRIEFLSKQGNTSPSVRTKYSLKDSQKTYSFKVEV